MKVELAIPNPDFDAAWQWIESNGELIRATYPGEHIQVANDPTNPVKGHGKTLEESLRMIDKDMLRSTPLISYRVPGPSDGTIYVCDHP